MPVDYQVGGKYVKLPKVGEEPKEFHIKTCKRIDDPDHKFNFMVKEEVVLADGKKATVEKNAGFRIRYELFDGSCFDISSWKPYYAFGNADVQDGCKIKVSHPEEGKWTVEVLERGVKAVDVAKQFDAPEGWKD